MFRFSKQSIAHYANNYDNNYSEKYNAQVEKRLKRKLTKQRYLTKEDFIEIGRWKSKRPTKHYKANDHGLIREVSKIAFSTKHEELRIKVLTTLNGCNFPLASTILHFKFPNRYPIIDYRVLWSLYGMKQPIVHSFDLWQRYVKDVRSLAKRYGISIRTLDKALWKYSEENQ